MYIFSALELVYFVLEVVFLFTALFCALVRTFHICKSYTLHVDYFFPARHETAFCALMMLLEFPLLIHFRSFDALFYAQAYAALVYPVTFALMVGRYYYFDQCLNWKWFWSRLLPTLLLCSPLFYYAMKGGSELLAYQQELKAVVAILCIFVNIRLYRYVKNILKLNELNNKLEYSNEEDVPNRKALRFTIYIVPIQMIFMLSGVLFCNPFVRCLSDVVMIISILLTLLIFLHPNRPGVYDVKLHAFCPRLLLDGENDKTDAEFEAMDMDYSLHNKPVYSLSDSAREHLLKVEQDVQRVILESKMFCNIHLCLRDLQPFLPYTMSEMRMAIRISNYKNFSDLVNDMRIDYCLSRMSEFSKNQNLDSLASDCGFSRASFYRVFKERTGCTPQEWYLKHN